MNPANLPKYFTENELKPLREIWRTFKPKLDWVKHETKAEETFSENERAEPNV